MQLCKNKQCIPMKEKVFRQLEIYPADTSKMLEIPFVGNIKAGFPSPADDFVAASIDLNNVLIKNPEATFFARANGTSMETDLSEGDLFIIDKSLPPADGKVAVCFVDGEFTVKRIKIEKTRCMLIPSNADFPVIEVNENNNFMIWGIVTYAIRKM